MLDKMTIIAQLRALLQLAEDGDFETLMVQLKEVVKIRGLVAYYTNGIQEKLDGEDEIIIELLIKILQEIFNNSTLDSPVPDDEYDQLYEIHRDVSGNEIVGATSGDGMKLNHAYPDLRGTLDKVHFLVNTEKTKAGESRKSVEDWINSASNRIGRPLHPEEMDAILFPKWDGISVVFEIGEDDVVERALSRGDTEKNEAKDLSRMFRGTRMFESQNPFKGRSYGLKTEIVMARKDFDRFCMEYGTFKSPRSAVSSIFNSNDMDKKYLEYLTVIPLQVQDSVTREIKIAPASLEVYPVRTCRLTDTETMRENFDEIRKFIDKEFGIDIDGIVVRLTNPHVQTLLGREDKINKYEFAYKFPPERKKAILEDVVHSVGILGAITPVAKIQPVKMKGNTISSITLGSPEIFESLKLNKGDEVIIKYDVIPGLEIDDTCKKGSGEAFILPEDCPVCAAPLIKDPVLRCFNTNCESRIIGKIMNYVEKMRIADISIGKITTLFNRGFLNGIEDLYRIKDRKREIAEIPGFGEKSIQKILDGIDLRREVFDYDLVGSLGIPSAGRKMFQKVLAAYTLDELMDICAKNKMSKLLEIAGIKEKTAERIIVGVNMNADLIRFLRSELKVKRNDREYKMRVAFTKVRDSEFEKYLDGLGILVTDYNNKVDVLVVPELGTTSSKVEKARKAGKQIVTIADAYVMFKYPTDEV